MKKTVFASAVLFSLLLFAALPAQSQDFTVVIIPDPQNLANFNSSLYNAEMQWIANNRASSNIVFVTCVGDLCNLPYNWWGDLGRSDAAFDILDVNNVPYSVSPGNHDMYIGTSWPNYFGVSRFSGKSWFGGSYDDYNTYSLFSASCNDFLIINLQFEPSAANLTWADGLLKSFPGRHGIVVQHDILNYDNSWTNDDAYVELKDNPNLLLMLCGHNYNGGSDGAAYRSVMGDDGHTIHLVMADYQEFSPMDYLRFLRFSPDDDLIYMTTYSPSTGNYITSSPDKLELAFPIYDHALTWKGSYASAPNGWQNKENWAITGSPAKAATNAPRACSDVVIPDVGTVNFPIVSTSAAVCNNLSIEAKGQLTIQPGAKLTISGQTVIQSSSPTENGSLIVDGTLSPATITYYRQLRSIANFGDYHYFSAPVGNQAISGFKSTDNFSATIWDWQENNATPWQILSTGSFAPGKGYNLAQSGGNSRFAFTGSLAATSLSVGVTAPYNSEAQHYNDQRDLWGGGGWNLLGNPFTSAMDASRFISANLASFDPSYQALYIYDGVSNTYQYAAATVPGYLGEVLFGSVIQAGQGFFVLPNYNGLSFNFVPGSGTSGMQTHHTSVEMKSAAKPWPGLTLKVTSGEMERTVTVVYNDQMKTGLDPGYDVGQLPSGDGLEIYTALVQDNGVNFTRQALPLADYHRNIIPVGVDVAAGGAVTFSAEVLPPVNYCFVLEDRLLHRFINLGEEPYSVVLPKNSTGTGRFFIHTSNTDYRSPITDYRDGQGDAFRIWSSRQTIYIEGAATEHSTAQVFDLLGRKIIMVRLNPANLNTITLPAGLSGIYLVKVTDGEKSVTEKVVIGNR